MGRAGGVLPSRVREQGRGQVNSSEQLNLLVVIVCYKAAELTIDCLRSLEPEIAAIDGAKVAICENGTGEESVATLRNAIDREGWSDWILLTVISPNRGFSGGNNVIIEEAMSRPHPPRHLLLLNADTIVRSGALVELMRAAEANPKAGIVGPRLEDPDGSPQISCFGFHNPLSELIRGAHLGFLTRLLRRFDVPRSVSNEPIEPDWTTFACALIRREVFAQVGVLDEGFYLYFDDPDFCRRARRAGWTVLHWPAAHVVHLGGRSNPVKSLAKLKQRRPAYYYASRARYFAKYYGRGGLWMSNVLWTLGRVMSWFRERLGRAPHACHAEWRDIWVHAWQPLKLPETARPQADGRAPAELSAAGMRGAHGTPA